MDYSDYIDIFDIIAVCFVVFLIVGAFFDKSSHDKKDAYYYKDKPYLKMGVVLDVKTQEESVLYKPIYECDYQYFSRPKIEFDNLFYKKV